MTPSLVFFQQSRQKYHAALLKSILGQDSNNIPWNSDSDNSLSIVYAKGILSRIGTGLTGPRLPGQTAGKIFEEMTCGFIQETFTMLGHLRPGKWHTYRGSGGGDVPLAKFEQYAHLSALKEATSRDAELAASLSNDYLITPDIVIVRDPEPDTEINRPSNLVDATVSQRTSLRAQNGGKPLLHASISCKWTMRSDRAQNARSEALNLMRNRKGRVPHIVVVTGEPLPTRLSSIAIGTGDIDCIYHFALHELLETVADVGSDDAKELMAIMIDGKRLRDISDLPLDLAV
jgi:hypothetical protein